MLTGLALEGQRRPGVPGVLASRIPTKIQKPMPYATTSSSKTANLKIVQKQLLFGLRLLFLRLCCLRCVVGCFLHGTSLRREHLPLQAEQMLPFTEEKCISSAQNKPQDLWRLGSSTEEKAPQPRALATPNTPASYFLKTPPSFGDATSSSILNTTL